MTRGSSPRIFAYLPISRFAVARSSSVTSAGNGNSAISLLTSRADRPRIHRAIPSSSAERENESQMAYVITEAWIGVKDASWVDVWGVGGGYTTDADNMYFIHPDECIDCGACE